MYLISIYFDENSTKIIKKHINQIAAKTHNNFMTDNNVPPHMTISAIEARTYEVLEPAFTYLGNRLHAGNIEFVSIGQLLPYVFYMTPVFNEYLSDLSNEVYGAFKDIPDTKIGKYYQRDNFFPHVTLGKTLTKKQMQAAFGVMQEIFVPFKAMVTEIGLARVNPHVDIERIYLKNK